MRNKFLPWAISLGFLYQATFALYYIKKYDHAEDSTGLHSIVKGDPVKYYKEAQVLRKSLHEVDLVSWLKPLEDHRNSYLYPRLLSLSLEAPPKTPVNLTQVPESGIGLKPFLIQIALYFCALIFLYRSMHKLIGSPTREIWMLFLIFDPSLAEIHSSTFTETLFISILIFFVGALLKCLIASRAGRPNLDGAVLGFLAFAAFLARAVAILLPVAVLATGFYLWRLKAKSPERLALLRNFAVTYMLCMIAFGLANRAWFGEFMIAPTQGQDILFRYFSVHVKKLSSAENTERKDIYLRGVREATERAFARKEISQAMFDARNDPDFIDRYFSLDSPLHERLAVYKQQKKIGIEWCLENPIGIAKVWIRSAARYFFLKYNSLDHYYRTPYKDEAAEEATRAYFRQIFWIRIIYSLLIYLPFALGTWLCLRHQAPSPEFEWNVILLAILGYLVLFSSWLANARYNLPNMIVYTYFCSAFWARFIERSGWLKSVHDRDRYSTQAKTELPGFAKKNPSFVALWRSIGRRFREATQS